MATNTNNVTAGKPKIGGAISVGATTLAMPTDATTALAQGFDNLGYVSEDGVTKAITRDSEAIKAWGGDTVMTTQTDYAETYQFSLIETLMVAVKKCVYGDENVTGDLTTGITAKSNSTELPAHAWVFDMVQNGAVSRIVVPNGKVTEIGDITYVDGEPVAYGLTITALPDASGNCAYEYTVTA